MKIYNLLDVLFTELENTYPSISDKTFENKLREIRRRLIKNDASIVHSAECYEDVLAFIKPFAENEFETIYCEREWRSVKEYHFEYTERSFKLPLNVDPKKISASAENGIITVKIPKKEVKEPIKQQITIQ